MEPGPIGETGSFSGSQETPRSLWKPNVHFGVYKIPPPVAVVTQIHPLHTHTRTHNTILISLRVYQTSVITFKNLFNLELRAICGRNFIE